MSNEINYNDYLKPIKFVNDPVYGGIPINEIEWRLIATPAFQRLRGLRQLGRVDYVFPGAEHSRFVHSLGVLYIMQLMTDHLMQQLSFDAEDAIKMRVAALLHDIGHYPLSHIGESVYGYRKDQVLPDQLLSGSSKNDSAKIFQLASSHSKSAHHEHLGKYIVCNNNYILDILNEYNLDPEEISSIFTGEIGSQNMVYSQLLHSSLDADRLDYLLRDSYQTGVQYGHVDLRYLIRILMVVEDKDLLSENKQTLACNKKGQHVVEHFLMSRYFHYSQIIFHKTNAAFEGLVKTLYIKLIEANSFMYNTLDEIHDHINDEDFIKYNDASLEASLEQHYNSTEDEDFKLLYKKYTKRKRPKVVFDIKDLYSDNPRTEFSVLKWILKRNPEKITDIIDSERWGYQIVPITLEGIQGRYSVEKAQKIDVENLREAVKMYDKTTESVTYLAADDLSIVNKLADYRSEFIRIFVLEEKDDMEYKRIEQAIKAEIQS